MSWSVCWLSLICTTRALSRNALARQLNATISRWQAQLSCPHAPLGWPPHLQSHLYCASQSRGRASYSALMMPWPVLPTATSPGTPHHLTADQWQGRCTFFHCTLFLRAGSPLPLHVLPRQSIWPILLSAAHLVKGRDSSPTLMTPWVISPNCLRGQISSPRPHYSMG